MDIVVIYGYLAIIFFFIKFIFRKGFVKLESYPSVALKKNEMWKDLTVGIMFWLIMIFFFPKKTYFLSYSYY